MLVAFALAGISLVMNLLQEDFVDVLACGLMMLSWAVLIAADEIAEAVRHTPKNAAKEDSP